MENKETESVHKLDVYQNKVHAAYSDLHDYVLELEQQVKNLEEVIALDPKGVKYDSRIHKLRYHEGFTSKQCDELEVCVNDLRHGKYEGSTEQFVEEMAGKYGLQLGQVVALRKQYLKSIGER